MLANMLFVVCRAQCKYVKESVRPAGNHCKERPGGDPGPLTSVVRVGNSRTSHCSLESSRPAAWVVVGGDSSVYVSPLAHLQKKPPTVELLICSACFSAEILIARCQEIASRAAIIQTTSVICYYSQMTRSFLLTTVSFSYSLCICPVNLFFILLSFPHPNG